MKNQLLLFVLGTIVTLSSCKKEDPVVSVQSVSLNQTTCTLTVGDKATLCAAVAPVDATNKKVIWNSSPAGVVTVVEGVVTAAKEGVATVIVTTEDGKKTAECKVTVAPVLIPVNGVSVAPATLSLKVGQTSKLIATVAPGNASNTNVEWGSNAPTVASVNKTTGEVKAETVGSAIIIATTEDGKKTAECKVTVTSDVTPVITEEEINLPVGKLKVVTIPAGTFMMGSPTTEADRYPDETQHSVTLSKEFKMGKFEITNEQFAIFLNDKGVKCEKMKNPWGGEDILGGKCTWGENEGKALVYDSKGSNFSWGVNWDAQDAKWLPLASYEKHPAIWVTWYGASEFAQWAGGSLPTEAQWEYACRGDYVNKASIVDTYPFGIGNGTKLDYTMANFLWKFPYKLPEGQYIDETKSSPQKTQIVGSYAANSYGLHDMHGNVYEWCSDWYDENFGSSNASNAVSDPSGPSSGEFHVIRGGNWFIPAKYCRSALRGSNNPSIDYLVGFRIVVPITK